MTAQETKIVGIGATTRARFNGQLAESPPTERNHLAWAQGFMSGEPIRASAGADEELDLLPSTSPLPAQAEFLRAFRGKHPDRDHTNAVHGLYRRIPDAAPDGPRA